MQVLEKLSQQSTANLPLPFKEKSLIFAPMEGITDIHYRETILENYPEWDFVATDFLRAPSVGPYPVKHVLKHYGKSSYEDPEKQRKTIYQMLTTEDALTEDTVSKIRDLGFKWLDLNLGCPSKTVCKHRGGSFLLSDLQALRKVIKTIRSHFPHTFTAKIRVGYKDDTLFKDILRLLEDEGVDAITIHARTRDEMYKGVAKWEYVKTAVETVKTPIVGNGDIPDVYTLPFHNLKFNLSKEFGKDNSSKISLKFENILNDKFESVYQSFGAQDQIFSSRYPGQAISLGYSYQF